MNGIDGRPLVFEKVRGQDRAKRLLFNTLKENKLSRAYLFSGAWSVGKTTLVHLFARSLLCHNRDMVTMSPCNQCSSCKNFLRGNHSSYLEVDAASFGTKENMVAILSTLAFENGDLYRIIFLDEAHRISASGKDALLKELETPIEYDGTIFLFSTNEPDKMPKTLMSRCTRVPLEKPTTDDVLAKITEMCKDSGTEFDRHALRNLAVWSQGHFRDAENAITPLILMGGINQDNVAAYISYDVEGTSNLLLALEGDLSKALNLGEELSSKYGAESIHSSLIRVLLEAVQYGLSGMSLDVPECVKIVYNSYGSRMGALLSHFLGRSKITDGKFLQAELVYVHYRFIKGDMDTGKLSFSSSPGQSPSQPKEQSSSKADKPSGIPTAAEQRAIKAAARKSGAGNVVVDENISKQWGPEEVADAVSFRRS